MTLRRISEFDPAADRILKAIPKDLPQAQYSTWEQMHVVHEFARKLKLYDALDYLDNSFFKDNA
jgi:hypothetical protein